MDSPALAQVKTDFETYNQAKLEEEKRIKEEEERRQRLIEEQRERARQLAEARRAALIPAEEPKEEEEVVAPSELIDDETAEEAVAQSGEQATSTPIFTPPAEKSPFEKALDSARKIASTNSEEAVNAYWSAINMGDDTGIAFHELSRLYFNRTQYSEAEMTALEALRRDQDRNLYLLTYLHIIRKTKAKPDVVEEIQKYRRLYPKNADLVLLLARIYAEPGGDSAAARSLYDLFFEMAPNHPDTDRARYEARGI